MKKTVFRCPTADFDCPYCDADGYCSMENPIEECDDAANCADDDCYPIEIDDPDMGFDPYLGCYTDDC